MSLTIVEKSSTSEVGIHVLYIHIYICIHIYIYILYICICKYICIQVSSEEYDYRWLKIQLVQTKAA